MQDSNFHSFEHFSKHFHTLTYSNATNPCKKIEGSPDSFSVRIFLKLINKFSLQVTQKSCIFLLFLLSHVNFLNHCLSLYASGHICSIATLWWVSSFRRNSIKNNCLVGSCYQIYQSFVHFWLPLWSL